MTETHRDRIDAQHVSAFQGRNRRQFNRPAAERWAPAYRHLPRRWLPGDKAAAIADVACGDGSLVHFFQSQGYANVSGVEVSGEQVAVAGRVCPGAIQGNMADHLESHEVGFTPQCLGRLLVLCGFEEMDDRETEPVPRGYRLVSSIRWLAWRAIRVLPWLWNLVETGAGGNGVSSRVLLSLARKAENRP